MTSPASVPPSLERELANRILVSEQRRAAILARLLTGFVLLTTAYVVATLIRGEFRPGYGWILLLGLLGCGFEWCVSLYLASAIRRGLRPARFRFYLNALVELSLPTGMILITAETTNANFATTGPAAQVYYLFIILSALRLDFFLCVFTGSVAALGCALTGALNWKALVEDAGVPEFAAQYSFLVRVLLLLLGGVVAGLVSLRLRRTLVDIMESVRERERVVTLFGQHVSPAVVDQLLVQRPEDASEIQHVCLLVLDIRNFTGLSERLPPAEVVALLNQLWHFMVQAVNDHGGFINKFLGDGFLAVFGAPVSSGNDCQNALSAARRILRDLDERMVLGTLPPLAIGMALHAGEAIVGSIGSAERKEFTVIGDTVNVAFRLEALNKELGSRLLISEPVRQVCQIDDALPIAAVSVRGRSAPVTLHRLA